MPDSVLAIDHVTHFFGGVKAVDDCCFTVERGTITALIGPNGAGKTTLVNLVSGAIACRKGSIVFDGHVISGRPSHQIARRGLIRSFQISRELGSLTVLENLLVVVPDQRGESLFNTFFRPKIGREETRGIAAKGENRSGEKPASAGACIAHGGERYCTSVTPVRFSRNATRSCSSASVRLSGRMSSALP